MRGLSKKPATNGLSMSIGVSPRRTESRARHSALATTAEGCATLVGGGPLPATPRAGRAGRTHAASGWSVRCRPAAVHPTGMCVVCKGCAQRRRDILVAGSTAEAAALFRAAGALIRDRELAGPDFMAARLIPWAVRISTLVKIPGIRRLVPWLIGRALPGALWFEVVRTKYMDDVLRQEIRAGATQVVILGAGLDSRPYRMAVELAGTVVFEVDHPSASMWKQSRLRATLGSPATAPVRYVTADLPESDLAESLEHEGYDRSVRSVVVWSGVTPYLAPHDVDATLRWMARQAPGSCLVFDYCWQEIIDGTANAPGAAAVMRAAAGRGEPWLSGIPRGQAPAYVTARGLLVDESLDIEATRDRYLTRRDGSTVGPVWDFGGFVRARVPPHKR